MTSERCQLSLLPSDQPITVYIIEDDSSCWSRHVAVLVSTFSQDEGTSAEALMKRVINKIPILWFTSANMNSLLLHIASVSI